MRASCACGVLPGLSTYSCCRPAALRTGFPPTVSLRCAGGDGPGGDRVSGDGAHAGVLALGSSVQIADEEQDDASEEAGEHHKSEDRFIFAGVGADSDQDHNGTQEGECGEYPPDDAPEKAKNGSER